uniref:Ral guanine nucleotide dissociation stimulator-like 3a n=1 Tax=Electrophorus electricus TaxID=8005 RepID=A0AAY5EPS6_ELEEL
MNALLDPVQEWGEEMEEGVVYGVTLLREPTPASLPTANVPDASSTQSCMQYRTLKARRVKAAGLERLVSELVKPDCEDPDYARIFLSSYRAFTSPSTLIQLLTLPLLVRLWLDEFWEDLRESPEHQPLRLLCVHLRHRLCFRRLARQAEALLQTFKEEGNLPPPPPPVYNEHLGVCRDAAAPGEMYSEARACPFSHACPWRVLPQDLFVRVVPFHCLGCVWSQRDKKENRSLAPTVRATIAQFNSVTNAVITSLLSPPTSSTPMHRARIIEKWISVAQECRQLRNFSSLRAILSALQSNAVYRLKNTWAAVSRESLVIFDHLCETFPDENCVLTTREFLVESGSSGEVPYLGTYLTVLTMLDTALPDTDGLINFEKRRREFEVLSQIRQLQTSCALYCLPSHPVIASWLNSCNTLTEQQSYDLSVKLEPPVDVCPNSPPTWRRFLIFLGQSGSCVNISADSGCSSSRCSSPGSCTSCTSSQLDLCVMSSDGASSNPLSSCTSSSTSCLPQQPPCYKQGPDSYVIRVSLEIDSGNVYKSILITSQDKTSQVVQRALDKHNLEDLSCHDFSLVQILPQGKGRCELWMPDKANVFYAMYPSDNYDFVLRQLWRNHSQAQNPCCSPAATPRGRHVK